MYCQNCGQPLRNDARFCGVCGTPNYPPTPAPGQGMAPAQPPPGAAYPGPVAPPAQPAPLAPPGHPQAAPYQQPVPYQQAAPPASYAPYPQSVQQPMWQPGSGPAQPQLAQGYPQPYYSQQAMPASQPPVQAQQPAAYAVNAPLQRPVAPPPGSVVAPIVPGATYPAFGRRAAAFLIDIFLVLLFIAVAALPLSGVLTGMNTDALTIILAVIVSLGAFAFLLWYPIIQPGQTGQTMGKRLLNVKVVDRRGNPPGIDKMAVRFLIGYPLCAIIMGVGFLVPLWDVQRQALDDKLVDTYVIDC